MSTATTTQPRTPIGTVVVLRTQPDAAPSSHRVLGRRGSYLRMLALDGSWAGRMWTANGTTSARILAGATDLA